MNLGGGGCGEPRWRHCTPDWSTRVKLHLKIIIIIIIIIIRGTETELEKEIEGKGNHPTGTWAMNLKGVELASPPGPRNQPQGNVKVHPVCPCEER